MARSQKGLGKGRGDAEETNYLRGERKGVTQAVKTWRYESDGGTAQEIPYQPNNGQRRTGQPEAEIRGTSEQVLTETKKPGCQDLWGDTSVSQEGAERYRAMFFWAVQSVLFITWLVFNLYHSYTVFRLKTDTPAILRNPVNELLLYAINYIIPLIAGILTYMYHNILWAGLSVAFYVSVWRFNTNRGYRKAFQTYKRLHVYDLKERGILDRFTEQEIDDTIRRLLDDQVPGTKP